MYNRDMSILYHSSNKQIDFIKQLNIHHTTFTKHLTHGTYYLGKYLFSRDLIEGAVVADMTLFDLQNQLAQDRVRYNLNKPVNSNSVAVVLIDDKTGHSSIHHSLGATIKALTERGYNPSQKTLVKNLDTDQLYCGHKCYRAPYNPK
jgi:hypothetical protein